MPRPLETLLRGFVDSMTLHHTLPLHDVFATMPTYPNVSSCAEGDLTWEGVLQHISLGAALKNVYYGHPWFLLPADWNQEAVELYSTPVPRTYQSALAFLYGFLPNFSVDRLRLLPSDNRHFCVEPFCVCPRLEAYQSVIDDKKKSMLQGNPVMLQLTTTLGKVLSPRGDASDFQAPMHVFDGLMGFTCQSKALPCSENGCATMDHVGKVTSYVDWLGKTLSEDGIFRRSCLLEAYSLLIRMHGGLRAALNGTSRAKFLFFSGHDVNLTTVASTLGFDDGVIPPYASRLIFEAYARGARHFFRVLYNGRDVTRKLIFCKDVESSSDATLCSFDRLTSFLKKDFFSVLGSRGPGDVCDNRNTESADATFPS